MSCIIHLRIISHHNYGRQPIDDLMDSNSHIASAKFTDFDEYANAIEGAQVRVTLPKLKKPLWKIGSVALPNGMQVQYASEGSGSLAQLENSPDGCNLFLNGTSAYRLNGEDLSADSAYLIPPRSEVFLCAPDENSWASVYVPRDLMRPMGFLSNRAGKPRRRPQNLGSAPANRWSLCSYVMHFISTLSADRSVADSPEVLQRFQNELMQILTERYGPAVEVPHSCPGRPLVADRKSIDRAVDAIEASPFLRISIKELEAVTGVPERSLRRLPAIP